MSATQLVLHRGAREVTEEELDQVEAPPPTETWFPKSHSLVLRTVRQSLGEAGFDIANQRLALSRCNARFFGVLDLTAPIAEGVALAVGVRNSIDQSLPIGAVFGSRVFVCDNLAFSSEVTIAKRHTKYGEQRFVEAASTAMQGLAQFRAVESERISRLQGIELSEDAANSFLLQAFEKSVLSSRLLPLAIREWREPTVEEFQTRTA